MTKNEFMEFMKENFELNPIHRNLLLAIYDYAEEHNHCKYNWILDKMLRDAFGDDISEEEYSRICTVEE